MNENNNESKNIPGPDGRQEANGEPSAELRTSASSVEPSMPASAPPAIYPLAALSFRFAKTMKDAPHEYVIRSPENEEAYAELFKLIGEHAVPEEWRGRTYGYWYAGDGWKYWRLEGYPWIINRARAAPMNTYLEERNL